MKESPLAQWIARIQESPKATFGLFKTACGPTAILIATEAANANHDEALCDAYADPANAPDVADADIIIYSCPNCTKQFATNKDLNVHRANHHKAVRLAASYAPISPTCQICLLTFGGRGQCIEHLARSPCCMLNTVMFGEQLDGDRFLEAEKNIREASRAARSLGLRGSCTGLPYTQAYGPIRRILLPLGGSRRSRHIPLRLALENAIATVVQCKFLGGVSSIDVIQFKRSVLRDLSLENRDVLGISV